MGSPECDASAACAVAGECDCFEVVIDLFVGTEEEDASEPTGAEAVLVEAA